MITFSIKNNLSEILHRKLDKYLPQIQRAVYLGCEKFIAWEQDNEMSGRPGLERVSGNLARNWTVSPGEIEGKDFTVTISSGEWYGTVHQTGMTIRHKNAPYLVYNVKGVGWRKSEEVTIPKRLHIYENFEEKGMQMIMDKIGEIKIE